MSESVFLPSDTKVTLAGCDIDGISRGKVVIIDKVLEGISKDLGFCSVIFGWDCHDKIYETHTNVSSADNGFADVIAKIDLTSFRRSPFDSNPFLIVDFIDPLTRKPLFVCCRSLLKRLVEETKRLGYSPNCGMEFEFYNFKETLDSFALKRGVGLETLSKGMFGYSLTRTALHQAYFDDIYDYCRNFDIPIEGLHTETGPGVFEAALKYTDALGLADRAHLFKTLVKQIGIKHGILACFMAKPQNDLPGCSGHIHVSLAHLATGKSAFANNATGDNPMDMISQEMKHFLAGVLVGLPSMMAIYAPTINSYKRLVENMWAPVTVTYGFENRTAAIRLIAPPLCPASATRLEMRVSGADCNPYLAVAALIGCGNYGMKEKLPLPFPPLQGNALGGHGERFARNLQEATLAMNRAGSIARLVLGDSFVDHFVATRRHEWGLWERSVTDWEVTRYCEVI